MLKGGVRLIALTSLLLSGAAVAQETIKVGVTATLEGTYTVLGEDGIRGYQTALNVLGKRAAAGQRSAAATVRQRAAAHRSTNTGTPPSPLSCPSPSFAKG
jgi:hypothetical protein